MKTTILGDLQCRIVHAETAERPTQVVLLNHGYGAPGDDLVGLGLTYLRIHPADFAHTWFVFPEAPLSLPGMPGARAWWHIDMVAIQEMMMRGESKQYRDAEPEGTTEVRRALLRTVDVLMTMTGLSTSNLIVGGFSQGAMSTCDLALSLEEAPGGLIQFSGTLLNEARIRRLAAKRAGLRVVQSHGREDPVLSFTEAEALRDVLISQKLNITFVPFSGGHEIPQPAFDAAADLLRSHAQECNGQKRPGA